MSEEKAPSLRTPHIVTVTKKVDIHVQALSSASAIREVEEAISEWDGAEHVLPWRTSVEIEKVPITTADQCSFCGGWHLATDTNWHAHHKRTLRQQAAVRSSQESDQ